MSYDYYPFGLTFNSYTSGTENLYKYNGKEEQKEWSVYDFDARMYDAALARFLHVDPLADEAPDWTPYRYGFNNPLKFVDPTGMFEHIFEEREDGSWEMVKETESEVDEFRFRDGSIKYVNKDGSAASAKIDPSEITQELEENNAKSKSESMVEAVVAVSATAISVYEGTIHDFQKYETPGGQKRNLTKSNGNTVKSPSAAKQLKLNKLVRGAGVVGNVANGAVVVNRAFQQGYMDTGTAIDVAAAGAAFVPGFGWAVSTAVGVMRVTVPLNYDSNPSPKYRRFGE